MDRFVARLNIEHYQKQLAKEQDESRRQLLTRLLAEERAKLATLNESSASKRRII